MIPGPTLGQIRTSLQAKGYGTDTAGAQLEAITSVYRELLTSRRWKFSDTEIVGAVTVAGVATVDLGAFPTALSIDAVRIEFGTEYEELDWVEPQVLHDLRHGDRTRDTPYCWSQYGSNLEFYPIPDKAYAITVNVQKSPTMPTVDASVLVIPSTYMDVIVWGAIGEMTFRERDWNAYNAARTQYKERTAAMAREYGIEQRQTPLEVTQTGIWDRVAR